MSTQKSRIEQPRRDARRDGRMVTQDLIINKQRLAERGIEVEGLIEENGSITIHIGYPGGPSAGCEELRTELEIMGLDRVDAQAIVDKHAERIFRDALIQLIIE